MEKPTFPEIGNEANVTDRITTHYLQILNYHDELQKYIDWLHGQLIVTSNAAYEIGWKNGHRSMWPDYK